MMMMGAVVVLNPSFQGQRWIGNPPALAAPDALLGEEVHQLSQAEWHPPEQRHEAREEAELHGHDIKTINRLHGDE